MNSNLRKQRNRILTGAAVGLISFGAIFTTFFTSEILIGTNLLLRIFFGISYILAASAIFFGLFKFATLFPLKITSTLLGSGIIVTWCIYNILVAFPILPFGTSLPLTIGVSVLICAIILIFAMLIGATIAIQSKYSVGVSLLFITLLAASAIWLVRPVIDATAMYKAISPIGPAQIGIPYPATNGNYRVKTLFYGSGNDKHRSEYGEHVSLKTESVDVSPFIPKGWSFARTYYWGFDYTQIPINGRVWFPDGDGKFPLVLIVHGTHKMTEPSDAGFTYLGELLASRGYIVASIDQNFFNYGWYKYGDFEESDIDARGWIILQHLKEWEKWNKTKMNPFFDKLDLTRIALIGHSRGGEAIAAATSFNRMGRYPKNGSIRFDFNFNIRTLIALSPSDIYQPTYERTTPAVIKNINYLLLQGTHDKDVPTIVGSRVYQRVVFIDENNTGGKVSYDNPFDSGIHMKAALYIYRANHSQFNTTWGEYDFPWPYRIFENTSKQLNGDEQRQIVQIYVSAFLDATLRGELRYTSIFRDYRVIGNWLPKTAYISRFQDSMFRAISNFDEDIDPGTTTVAGGTITGKNFSHWYEQDIDPHYYLPYGSRSNRVVSLRWDSPIGLTPSFRFQLPQRELKSWKIKPRDTLMFSIAFLENQQSPDINIELTDDAGTYVQLPLKVIFPLQMPLLSYLTKLNILEDPTPQIVLQTISIPLSRFMDLNPSFNLNNLATINFLFDSSSSGTVFIDDVGID
jgi:hypothetical protein